MLKRLVVALVGMAMGAMIGLGAAMMGLGNVAILVGAALGAVAFSIGAARVGRAG
ncbi:MAG: hypothetical protein ABSH50_19515 [Bryobacteraceae bacterium]|jgi:hypothetical protein